MIVLDYETRSLANLLEVGAHNYAKHPTTDILCLGMLDEATDERIVFDPIQQPMPKLWVDKLLNADFVGAVNATFDRLIHQHVGPTYDFPKIPYEKWYCLSAQFRVNALPANLEDAAKAAKVDDLKDPRGKQLIKLLSIPQDDGTFNECPKLMAEMLAYCMKDVLASVAVMRVCRRLTSTEHRDWLVCERMNDKGIKIDRQLAELASGYAQEEQSEISGKIEKLTNGVITKPTQHMRIKKYVLDAIQGSTDENDRHLLKAMTTYKDKVKKYTLDKNVREALITAIDEGNLYLYEDIEELIRLLDAASASSVAKFVKMTALASPVDDRVRGAFIHAGASQTHRFSSKGLQLHNMKRDCFTADDTEKMIDKMASGRGVKNVMQTLAKLLRPALIPADGHQFVVGDWAAIEGRGLPWLSGDPRAEKVLDIFREGRDLYIETCLSIGMTAEERQIGKVVALSLGFGGAGGAFNAMASNYGVVLPTHKVDRIVKSWRRANAWAVDFWAKLEKAAKNAIRKRGAKSFSAGRVTYHFIPQMMGGTLVCELPDGTLIQYPFARIEETDRGSGIVALKSGIKPKAGETKNHWGVVRLWGGLLAENITQAFCAGLLRNCLRDMGGIEKYLVAHVHDEIILETPIDESEECKNKLQLLMELTPAYAKGLPLKAKPVILNRYGNH